jgi:quinolinate synthase
VLWALEDMQPEVRVAADVRERARSAVDKMLAL